MNKEDKSKKRKIEKNNNTNIPFQKYILYNLILYIYDSQ